MDMGPCKTCGAMVGHRLILKDEGGFIRCPEGGDVSQVMYEAVCAERDAYLKNLTSVQTRCTQLLEECRAAWAVIGPTRQDLFDEKLFSLYLAKRAIT